jgi:hypothetical protein
MVHSTSGLGFDPVTATRQNAEPSRSVYFRPRESLHGSVSLRGSIAHVRDTRREIVRHRPG